MFLFILLFSISSLLNLTFCQEGEASNAYLIRANSNTCPKGVPERILQGINRFRFKNGLQGLGFSKETTAHSQLFTSQHLSHASWSLPEFGSFGRAAWLTSISPVPVNQQHKVEVNLAGAIDSLVAQCPPVMMVTERKFTEAEWASTRTMGVGCSSWTKPVVQRNVPSAVDFLVVIFFDRPEKLVVPQEQRPSVDDNQQVISSSTEGTGVDKLDDGGVGTTIWGDEGEEEDESKVVLVTEVLGAAAATLGFEMKHNLTTENFKLFTTTKMPEVLPTENLTTEKLTSTANETSSTSEVILTTEVFPTTKISPTTEAQNNDNFSQYLTTAEELPVAIFPDSTEMTTVNESTSFLLESTNYTTTSAISTDLPLNSTTASFTTVLDANSSSQTVETNSTVLPNDQTTVLFPLGESESTSALDTDSSINQTESTTLKMTEFKTSNSTTESLVTITEENSTIETEATIKDEPSKVDSVAVSDGNSSVESVVAITDGNSSVESVLTITADENSTTESVKAITDENSTIETLEMINADENSTTTTTTQTPNITTKTEQQLQHHLLTTALENSSTKLPIQTSSSSTKTPKTTTVTIPTTTTVQNEATAVHLSPETTTLPPPTTTTTAKITTTTESPNKTPEKTSTSSETPTSTTALHHHHHHHHVPCSPEYIHHLINFFNQVRNYRHQRQLTLSAKLSKSANLLAQLPAEGIDLPFSASFGTIVYHKRKDLLNNNNSSSSSNNSTEAKCNFTDAVMAIYASRLRPMLKGGRPFSHEQWDQAAEVGVGCYIFDNEEAGRTELHVVLTFAIPKGAFN